ncbi:MAG TPA: ATP-binding protein [Chitinophagaceae bacterium]|nr:ATP-binding protein [Chitinophagaceae bacterium]
MLKGWLKYLALIIFLLGLVLIVFLQFNSGKSIDRLIQGNTSLLKELQAQNDLQKLQTDIVTVESKVRGAIITRDTAQISHIQEYIQRISAEQNRIEKSVNNGGTAQLVQKLDTLVTHKILFNQKTINAFLSGGKEAAEKIINDNSVRSKRLTDSIFDAVDDVDSSRQVGMSQIITSIDDNGRTAKSRGLILASVACVFCIVAFWYIVHQSMQQQQLIHVLDASEKKVKEAARIKEQFMANMSHEIRTPMNAILGFTNLLAKTTLQPAQQQYVDNIQSSGENLLAIVNDILDLSKIEAGMMRIETIPFSLRGLIHSIETMFSEKTKLKNLYLHVSVEEEIPDTLEGDPVRLTQVLVNLLGNAVKFTDEGGIAVQVKKKSGNETGVLLQFMISDTGIGIPPDKQTTIFERFQQAEAETTRRHGGTGLGLSIARQLIDLQNGSIALQSEPGQGTRFTVELPYIISKGQVEESAHLYAVSHLHTFSKKISVLIAEDNQMNQQLMKHLMTNYELDFDLVDNGLAAVAALQKKQYDIVLMDIQMPEMDGYRTTQHIRSKLKSGIPIIAMTAHAMPGEKEKCLSYGMNDYISKPIREAELLHLMQRYTQQYAVTASKTDQPVIDLNYLKEISKGDSRFEQEMIRQFTIQVPEEIAALERAIQQRDYPTIRQLAHGLKSSVAFMGLSNHLGEMLQQMEMAAAHSADINDIRSDFEQLRHTCTRAIAEAGELLA